LTFLDIDLVGLRISLCGNYGDPIYHPDLPGFVAKLKQRGAIVSIVTNGSYRKVSWWQEFVSVLTAQDCVTFSVDGTPENFTQYRVNADWPSILDAMKVCVAASCQTEWKYIPFNYNQDLIDTVRELSCSIGIDEFVVSPSDRYNEHTVQFQPREDLIGSRYSAQQQLKNSIAVTQLAPKCHRGQQHFITADGYYTPCCFLADHRFLYKTPFGKNKKEYQIQNYTLSEILSRSSTIDFYQTLEQHIGCQYNCPA
jgi:MoaA/NifB/PqqE/SkfB family radical SAM enzyme